MFYEVSYARKRLRAVLAGVRLDSGVNCLLGEFIELLLYKLLNSEIFTSRVGDKTFTVTESLAANLK
jgi:hypothetical protein